MINKVNNTMRWQMFICLFTAVYLAVVGLYTGSDMLQLSPMVSAFLAAGVGAGIWNERAIK